MDLKRHIKKTRAQTPPPGDIQLFYARVIDRAAKAGFVLLLLTFAIYISGVLPAFVPVQELPRYWGQPARHYVEMTGLQGRWAWLGELHHGDFLNYLPIAFLAAVTIIGYLAVVMKFLRRRETILGMIVILEIIVLGLAASGVFGTGGH